jgi:hypothetical protein
VSRFGIGGKVVHRVHFTHLGPIAQPFQLSGKFDTSPARIH